MTTRNTTISYSAFYDAATQPSLPIVVLALDAADPFSSFMASDNSSIDAFLGDGPNGVQFLLTSNSKNTVDKLESAVMARLKMMSTSLQASWSRHLHFANTTENLAWVLGQWPTPRNMLSLGSGSAALNASRLDCEYISCPWVDQNAMWVIEDGGEGCDNITRHISNYALVRLNPIKFPKCTPEVAAAQAATQGASGVLLAQRPNAGLVAVGAPGFTPIPWANAIPVTMVDYATGYHVAATLATQGANATMNATFFTTAGTGQWVAIDAQGRLRQVGWEKYATLRMLNWEAPRAEPWHYCRTLRLHSQGQWR